MYIFIQKHLQYKIIVSLKGEFYDINRKIRKFVVKVIGSMVSIFLFFIILGTDH